MREQLKVDLGERGMRVNAISAGPVRTLAGSAVAGARHIFKWSQNHAPLMRNADLDDIGGSALYLLSELSNGVTGEVHHVDGGYNVIGVPSANRLNPPTTPTGVRKVALSRSNHWRTRSRRSGRTLADTR